MSTIRFITWAIFLNSSQWRWPKDLPLFVCLAAESQHNLQKVWFTVKLKELPSFVLEADLKAINFTTGIGTHDSCVVLQPLEEFVAHMRLLDVHWVPILINCLKLNTVTRSLTMRAYSSTHSTMSFPRNSFWNLSFDITLNLFITYLLLTHCSRV